MKPFVKLFEEYHTSDSIITKVLYRNWKDGKIDLNSLECRWSKLEELGDIVIETGIGDISWNIANEEIEDFEGDGWVKALITLSKDTKDSQYQLIGKVSAKYDRAENTFEFEPYELEFIEMTVQKKLTEANQSIVRGNLTDLSIRSLRGKENTMAFKVLKFIYDSKEEGVRYTDIVTFILAEKGEEYTTKRRGYYSTLLRGEQRIDPRGYARFNPSNEVIGYGLLGIYCVKLPTGKWVVNSDVQEYLDSYFAMNSRISKKGAMLLYNLR